MTRSFDSSKEPERKEALPVILLAGPTAAGKTALSLDLAQRFATEIVNADSMQIYRYMDIGTAKPSASEKAKVPHHLIDIADPDEPFDAARYVDVARPVIDQLHGQGRVPLVVGGTGLYMKVLIRGICTGPPSDPKIRQELLLEEESHGLARLHAELLRIDPEAGARIHPNDRQRVLRAIEVFRQTGVTLSSSQRSHRFQEELYPAIKIFLEREREELYARIERRVDAMIDSGLKEEVERLLSMGYGSELKPMQSLGYKQMCAHLLDGLPFDRAVQLIKQETRRYAKRQFTWFRTDPEYRTFHAEDIEGVFAYVREYLENL
jgi:tRNA dimethylallyltransferase